MWTWYPRVGKPRHSGLLEAGARTGAVVYGERDQLVPVDESLTKIEASLDGVPTPYTAVIVPNAQHNLTVQPEPGAPFFWWKAAPVTVDLVVAWVQQQTAESN